jgi:large subunit ribosomal protein L32
MPVPKRKTSKSRRDMRQANKGLKPATITMCKECGAAMMPHQACSQCGFYKGRKIFATKVDRTLMRAESKSKTVKAKKTETEAASTEQK